MIDLPDKKYKIIYADFPWPYTSFGTAKLPYNCMEVESIASFPWEKIMDKRCILFSWVTCPKLSTAFECAKEWEKSGLFFIGVPYVWIKTKDDLTPIGASGPRPRLVKPVDEFVLAFSTTPKKRTFPLFTESQKQNVFAPKPKKGEHSKKPPIVRDLIVELLGDLPRIELFARERVEGWDAWGDEI